MACLDLPSNWGAELSCPMAEPGGRGCGFCQRAAGGRPPVEGDGAVAADASRQRAPGMRQPGSPGPRGHGPRELSRGGG